MSEHIETLIVGGGQAGLAMSYHLSQRGGEHLVLERVRVAERWRTQRWDSPMFPFPNWSIELPGRAYNGGDPDGFSHKSEVLEFVEDYAACGVPTTVEDGLSLGSSHGEASVPKMLRFTAAVVVGVMVALALVAATDAISHAVYPSPIGSDILTTEQLNAHLRALPLGALLFVLFAWVIGTFGGACAASLVAGTRPTMFSAIIGVFVLAATIAYLIVIPHPTWLAVAGMVAVPATALAAGRVMSARLKK